MSKGVSNSKAVEPSQAPQRTHIRDLLPVRIPPEVIRDVILISVVGLVSLSWFRGDFLISTGDFVFPLDRFRVLGQSLHVWNDISLGGAGVRKLAGLMPYNILMALSGLLGLSLVTTERIYYYLCFTLSGCSMYYLSCRLVNRGKWGPASLVSALFYMMNMYVALFVLPGFSLSYTFLPFILGLYINGLDQRRSLRYAIATSITWTLLITTSYVNPAYAIRDWGVVLTYFPFFLVVERTNNGKLKHAVVFTAVLLLAWTTFNLYWILPLCLLGREAFAAAVSDMATAGMTSFETFKLNSASIFNALRLMGFWGMSSGYKGDPYVPWAPIYFSLPFVAISILVPTVVFASLLVKPANRHILYFALLSILGVTLVAGAYPPFEPAFAWLFTNVPLMAVLRGVYQKCGIILALGYSFLFGIEVRFLWGWGRNTARMCSKFLSSPVYRRLIRRLPALFVIVLVLGAFNLPFWTGEVVYGGGNVTPSARISIPQYYYDSANWLSYQYDQDFRIVSLPLSNLYYAAYSWEHGYLGADFSDLLFPKPVIVSTIEGPPALIANAVYDRSPDISKLLALSNVKYVLLHEDTNWAFVEGNPWWMSDSSVDLRAYLDSQPALRLERTFGELDFYRNENWKPVHFYAPNEVFYVDSTATTSLISLVDINGLDVEPAYIFEDSAISDANLGPFSLMTPVSYRNATEAVSYDGWRRYVDGTAKTMASNALDRPNALISYVLFAPKDGFYKVYACVRWDGLRGALRYQIDDLTWSPGVTPFYGQKRSAEPHYYGNLALGETYLSRGNHTLRLMNCADSASLSGLQNVASVFMVRLSQPTARMPRNLDYQRIDPTKYVVHVETDAPFYLVFSESYHQDWAAFHEGKILRTHFRVNGYANGWYLNETGSYDINIEFLTQSVFYLGAGISITAMALCLTYLVLNHVGRRGRKKDRGVILGNGMA